MWCYLDDPVRGGPPDPTRCRQCTSYREYSGLRQCTYLSPERKKLKDAEDKVKKLRMMIRMRENRIRRLRDTRYQWRFDTIRTLIAEIGQLKIKLNYAKVDLLRLQRAYGEEKRSAVSILPGGYDDCNREPAECGRDGDPTPPAASIKL